MNVNCISQVNYNNFKSSDDYSLNKRNILDESSFPISSLSPYLGDGMNNSIGPQVEPAADLREAEGEVKREADGRMSTRRGGSSNYLPVNGIATPGDRGEGSVDLTSGGEHRGRHSKSGRIVNISSLDDKHFTPSGSFTSPSINLCPTKRMESDDENGYTESTSEGVVMSNYDDECSSFPFVDGGSSEYCLTEQPKFVYDLPRRDDYKIKNKNYRDDLKKPHHLMNNNNLMKLDYNMGFNYKIDKNEMISQVYFFLLQMKLLNTLDLIRAVCHPWGIPPNGNDYVYHFDNIINNNNLNTLKQYESIFIPIYERFTGGNPTLLWTRVNDVDYFKIIYKLECLRLNITFDNNTYNKILKQTLDRIDSNTETSSTEGFNHSVHPTTVKSPSDVQSASVPLAESSFNSLPVNGNATPGDRGYLGECGGKVHNNSKLNNSHNDHVSSSPSNITSTVGLAAPPDVTTTVPLAVEPSSNYLSLKSDATPGDRGGGEGSDRTSSGPGSDLRELEGEINRRADGRTTSGVNEVIDIDLQLEDDDISSCKFDEVPVFDDYNWQSNNHSYSLTSNNDYLISSCDNDDDEFDITSAFNVDDNINPVPDVKQDVNGVTSTVLPENDLRELEGEVNRESSLQEEDKVVTSGGVDGQNVDKLDGVSMSSSVDTTTMSCIFNEMIDEDAETNYGYLDENILATMDDMINPIDETEQLLEYKNNNINNDFEKILMNVLYKDGYNLLKSNDEHNLSIDYNNYSSTPCLNVGNNYYYTKDDNNNKRNNMGKFFDDRYQFDIDFIDSTIKNINNNISDVTTYIPTRRSTRYPSNSTINLLDNSSNTSLPINLSNNSIRNRLHDITSSNHTSIISRPTVNSSVDVNSTNRSTLSSTRRGASSNYLSLKGIATPGDRGSYVVSTGPQVEMEPESDLRELEGELNKRADGRMDLRWNGEWKERTSGGGGRKGGNLRWRGDVDEDWTINGRRVRCNKRRISSRQMDDNRIRRERLNTDYIYDEDYMNSIDTIINKKKDKRFISRKNNNDKKIDDGNTKCTNSSSHVVSASVSYDKRQQRFMAQWKTREGAKHSKSFYAKRYATPLMARKHAELYKMYVLRNRSIDTHELPEPTYDQLAAQNFQPLENVKLTDVNIPEEFQI